MPGRSHTSFILREACFLYPGFAQARVNPKLIFIRVLRECLMTIVWWPPISGGILCSSRLPPDVGQRGHVGVPPFGKEALVKLWVRNFAVVINLMRPKLRGGHLAQGHDGRPHLKMLEARADVRGIPVRAVGVHE